MGNQRKRHGKSFFKKIRNDFGQNVLLHMKNFSHTTVQLATKSNQRILLLRCRKETILPQHLQSTASNSVSFDNDNVTRMHLSAIKRFLFSTLNLEIKDICISIYRLKNDIRISKQKIMQILPKYIYEHVFLLESNKAHRIFLSLKCSYKSKFERLIKGNEDFSKSNDNVPDYNLTDSWLTNLTDIHIPTEVVKTDSLGKNFGIPFSPKNIPTKQMISDFESNIHKIDVKDPNEARLKLLNCIKNFSNQKTNFLNWFQE